MAHPVRAIPEGYHSISPSLTCKDAARAIDFYKNVFGAEEMVRMPSPDGKISHAELKIGDSIIFVNDEMGPMTARHSWDAADVLCFFTSRMRIRRSREQWPPARRLIWRWRINSGVIVTAR